MSEKEIDKIINDKHLLGFKLPKKFKSFKPKRSKMYTHSINIFDGDSMIKLQYSSEKKARDAKKKLEVATNIIEVEYIKNETPIVNGGFEETY